MGAGGVQLRSLQRQEVVANLGAWPQSVWRLDNFLGAWAGHVMKWDGFECVPSKKKVDHQIIC